MIKKLYDDECTDIIINTVGFHRNVLNLIPYFSSMKNFADREEKEITFDEFSVDTINFFKRWLYGNKLPKLTFSVAIELYNLSNYFCIDLWTKITNKVSYLISSNYKNPELINFLCKIDDFYLGGIDLKMLENNLPKCETAGEKNLWCFYYIEKKDPKMFTLAQENLPAPWAINKLAYCYSNGFGVEKNKEKAIELYTENWEKNKNSFSKFRLIQMNFANFDKNAANELWTKYKNPMGLYLQGRFYEKRGEIDKALNFYEKDWKLNFSEPSLLRLIIRKRMFIPLQLVNYRLNIYSVDNGSYQCVNNSEWKETINLAEIGIQYFSGEPFYQELSFCIFSTNPKRFYKLQKICVDEFNSLDSKLNIALCLERGIGCEQNYVKALMEYENILPTLEKTDNDYRYIIDRIDYVLSERNML